MPHWKRKPFAGLVSITEAARIVEMSHPALRRICIEAGIAIRWGGTDAHPRLKVRMRDVRDVILSRRYVPQAAMVSQRGRRGPRPLVTLDPAVRC